MKPFDLEAALNGAKVITRDGFEVKQLTHFNVNHDFVVYGVIAETKVYSWTIDGKVYEDAQPNELDLFMAPNAKSIWVARVGDGIRIGAHPTKWECKEAHPDADDYHEITYEEQP